MRMSSFLTRAISSGEVFAAAPNLSTWTGSWWGLWSSSMCSTETEGLSSDWLGLGAEAMVSETKLATRYHSTLYGDERFM